jgi:hypothetical protein
VQDRVDDVAKELVDLLRRAPDESPGVEQSPEVRSTEGKGGVGGQPLQKVVMRGTFLERGS